MSDGNARSNAIHAMVGGSGVGVGVGVGVGADTGSAADDASW